MAKPWTDYRYAAEAMRLLDVALKGSFTKNEKKRLLAQLEKLVKRTKETWK